MVPTRLANSSTALRRTFRKLTQKANPENQHGWVALPSACQTAPLARWSSMERPGIRGSQHVGETYSSAGRRTPEAPRTPSDFNPPTTPPPHHLPPAPPRPTPTL